MKDLPIKDFNVGVASAISSYSRCRLWSLIDGIESKGKRVFMCDTDSVITDAKLNDYPDLMEEFMWDGCGDALGSLKNEADDHLKNCGWGKEEIKRLKEEEGGMLHFLIPGRAHELQVLHGFQRGKDLRPKSNFGFVVKMYTEVTTVSMPRTSEVDTSRSPIAIE